jgi:DNA invertase Pin-like site-specific DNA recombinase
MSKFNIPLSVYLSDVQPTDHWSVRWKLFYGVKAKRQAMGRRNEPLKKFDEAEIVQMHKSGMTNQEIVDHLGCSVETVRRAIRLDRLKNR